MASAQDHHGPVVKELSEKRLPADPTQTGQSQTRPRDAPDSPRPLTSTSETLREPTPPQLPGTLPGTFEPHPLRRATNSATLVNHPGTISIPNTGAGPGGAQNAPIIQDRNQPALYDPIRGDNTTQLYLPDEGEPDRRSAPRRVSVPRPRPVFSPTQDGNGNGNGPRGVPRGVSSTDSLSNPQVQGQVVCLAENAVISRALIACSSENEHDKTRRYSFGRRNREGQISEARYVDVFQETTFYVFLIFYTARYQSLTINGAIGLQVIVGALTTGVAAASKNVSSSHLLVSKPCNVDAPICRSGLLSLFSVGSLPR